MENIYPLFPDRITESSPTDEGGFGIIDKEHLIGIITEEASHLKNPVTIVEFMPNNKLNRIDSMSIHYDLHPPCRTFRKNFNCEHYCLQSDEIHANIFRGLTLNNLEIELNKKIKDPQSSFHKQYRQEYSSNPMIEVCSFFTQDENKYFLKYECPILGYRELLFPISIEQKIVGVLFVGELVLEDNLNLIDEIRTKFFKKNDNLDQSILEKLSQIQNSWVTNGGNVLSESSYNNIINDIIERITKLEKRIADILIDKRINFLNEKIAAINQTISYNFSESSDPGLNRFWFKTTSLLEKLSKSFPVEFICIFGTKDYSTKPSEKLSIQAKYDSSNLLTTNMQFDLSHIPSICRTSPCSSIDNPSLLNGLMINDAKIKTDSEKDLIRLIPTVNNPKIFLVVWVRYDNNKWARLRDKDKNVKEFNAFSNAISGFYALLAFKFSALWAEIAQERLETIFKILGHEIGQIIAEIDQNYWTPFSDYNLFRYLTRKDFQDLKDDFSGFLRQLAGLKHNSKFLIDELEPRKKEFYIFDEILFKWKETYKRFAQHKKIHIRVNTPVKEDPYRPMVYADPALIEQIVYNLLRNAIKYCYRGTNIWMDCFKEDISPESPHILTITSYGIPILECDKDRIYELHERGINTIKNDKNSQGIGLFLAKKIITAHKGRIYHTSNKVSEFYLPFLKPISENPELSKHPLNQPIIEYFNSIRDEPIYIQCCAFSITGSPLFYPSFREMERKMRKPIYETTFYVIIPPKS